MKSLFKMATMTRYLFYLKIARKVKIDKIMKDTVRKKLKSNLNKSKLKVDKMSKIKRSIFCKAKIT